MLWLSFKLFPHIPINICQRRTEGKISQAYIQWFGNKSLPESVVQSCTYKAHI